MQQKRHYSWKTSQLQGLALWCSHGRCQWSTPSAELSLSQSRKHDRLGIGVGGRTAGGMSILTMREHNVKVETKVAHRAFNWSDQQLVAPLVGAMRLGRFLDLPSHNSTFARQVTIHSDIGILSGGDSDGGVAQWAYLNRISKLAGGQNKEEPTGRGHAIVLELIVLGAVVGSGEKVLPAELEFAVLAFERQEIDEAAVLSGTLVSNVEEPGRQIGVCVHGGGIWMRARGTRHQGTGLNTPQWPTGHASLTAKSVPTTVTLRKRVCGITSARQNLLSSSRTKGNV